MYDLTYMLYLHRFYLHEIVLVDDREGRLGYLG